MKLKSKISDLLLLTGALLLLSIPAKAQYWTFGSDPSRVKWSQIKSDHFNLIYPQEIDSLAREYLRTMEKYRPLVNEGLKIDPLPIPVILHPYSTMSNGMVAWCPKNVHLITSPNPYSDSQMDWKIQLATHEMRHIGQSEHFTKGFYKYLYYLLGESITGVGMALFANPAYLEGDATITETLLTDAGRGRMSSFLMQIRADYLEGHFRNVEGHLMPSYHYQPYDKYAVGFMAMGAEMIRTNNYFLPGEFYNVNAVQLGGLTMRSSDVPFLSYDENFKKMQEIACGLWKADLAKRGTLTSGQRISKENRLYTDYLGAFMIHDTLSPLNGNIIALKKGMDYAPEIVTITPDGEEKHLCYHASYGSKACYDGKGRLYWSESVMHNPATSENFSEIKYYDIRRKALGTLTRSSKYFNPTSSYDGEYLAVAEYPIGKPSRLVLVSTATGEATSSVPSPAGGQIQETVFHGDNIYATVIVDEGVGVWRIDANDVLAGNNSWEQTLSPLGVEVRNLQDCNSGFCFATDIDGILNIYCYEEKSGEIYKLTNSKYGVNYPLVDYENTTLYFSEYQPTGYHISQTPIDSLLREARPWKKEAEKPYLKKLIDIQEAQSTAEAADNPDYLDPEKYPSKHYNKFLHSFKIHSWAPFYYNVDRILNMSGDQLYQMVSLGAVAYSQNDLGTVKTMLGYSYHGGFHSGHAKITSVIADFDVELSVDVNDRKQYVYTQTGNGSLKSSVSDKPLCQGQLTIDYPLNLYGGGWKSMLVPLISWRISNDRFDSYHTYYDKSATIGLRYYRMLPTAQTALFPRWGYSISAYHVLSLNTNQKMPLTYFNAYAYLPGIIRNQGLKLSAQAQYRYKDNNSLYYNNSYASRPRGYNTERLGLPSQKYAMVSADYAIPIWMGDLTIPYAFYFKRIELQPFADYAWEQTFRGNSSNLWSVGSDLRVDFSVLRFRFELSLGVRYCYTGPQGDLKRHNFSMLFGVKI